MLSEEATTNFEYEDALKTDPERVSPECAQYAMPVEKKFDFGITAGLGMELSMKKVGHIALEAVTTTVLEIFMAIRSKTISHAPIIIV